MIVVHGYKEARRVAEQHLAAEPNSGYLEDYPGNPYSPPVEHERVEPAILDSETIETEWGYLFFYQSKEYVETGKISAMLAGNAPLLVLKDSGELYERGTAEPIDHYIAELEYWLGVRRSIREARPDVTVRITMVPTAEGGRNGPAFSGYRPHFALREGINTSGSITFTEANELGPGESSTATVIFLSPSAAPRSIWPGRILRACEGARVVATAEVLEVHNPVLRTDEPLYEVVLGGEVLGRSPLAGRDPGMGVATGPFKPTFAFAKVASVFALFADSQGDTGTVDEEKLRAYYAARDQLDLALRSPEGESIKTDYIHIVDYRAELGPDGCELDVHVIEPGFFADDE